MKHRLRIKLLPILLFASTLTVQADDTAHSYVNELEAEIEQPVVPKKSSKSVRQAMVQQARTLMDEGHTVELMRDDEVIVVTIACSRLFGPNAITLLPGSETVLERFAQFMNEGRRYRLVMAMHSDDTGSPAYRESLCRSRLEALNTLMTNRFNISTPIPTFAMGSTQPVADNDSRESRAANRRLEIYILPDIASF